MSIKLMFGLWIFVIVLINNIERVQSYLTYRASNDAGYYSYDISLCAFDKSNTKQFNKMCLVKQKEIIEILKIIHKFKSFSLLLTNIMITNTVFKFLYKHKILSKTIFKYCWFEFSTLLVLPQNIREIEWKIIDKVRLWYSAELEIIHFTEQDFSKSRRIERAKENFWKYLSLWMIRVDGKGYDAKDSKTIQNYLQIQTVLPFVCIKLLKSIRDKGILQNWAPQ